MESYPSVLLYLIPGIPTQVVLDLVPVLEVGAAYMLICRIPNVAPIRNLTVTLSKGKEILHMKTFQNYAAPEASDVVVNHTIIAQQTDHREKIACHSALDLSPEGQLFEATSTNQLLNVFGELMHAIESQAFSTLGNLCPKDCTALIKRI